MFYSEYVNYKYNIFISSSSSSCNNNSSSSSSINIIIINDNEKIYNMKTAHYVL